MSEKVLLNLSEIPVDEHGAIRDFVPLQQHMGVLGENWPSGTVVTVNGLQKFRSADQKDRIGALYITSTYEHENGIKGVYCYPVIADANSLLMLFKATGGELAKPAYYVMTVTEPRIAKGDFHSLGLPGGLLEKNEPVREGTVRETWEEARLRVLPERLVVLVDAESISNNTTQRVTIMGGWSELDYGNADDRRFIETAQEAGFQKEGERTFRCLTPVSAFMAHPDMQPQFYLAMIRFAAALADLGETGVYEETMGFPQRNEIAEQIKARRILEFGQA